MDIGSARKLSNGVEIPVLGLGTFRSEKGAETQNAVAWALEAGYRHIDTAAMYGNEEDVGLAVAQSRVKREDVFITTKLRNDDQGYESTLKACEESLRTLKMDYIDLYLVHWPVTSLREKTWEAFIKLYEEGKCRAIGVSNYTIRHLNELLAHTPLVPMVNQIEIHPFLYRKDLIDFCMARNIAVEAYSPLSKARRMDDPRLVSISGKYQRSGAQVLVRWSLQHGWISLPKSARQERIVENANVFDFELDEADMLTLDSMDEGYYTVRPDWIPDKWV
jgi:diketogulonate reductase-like aldo/keto reductase